MPPAADVAVIIITVLISVAAIAWLGYMQVGNFVKVLANFRRAKSERRKRAEVEIAV